MRLVGLKFDPGLDQGRNLCSASHAMIRVVILRCTTRVLALLGIRPQALPEVPATDDDWYANLFWVERRKCLLLMHTSTLFPVLVADVSKRDLRDVGSWVTRTIATALASERLGPATLGPLDPPPSRWAGLRAAGCSGS